MSPRMTRRQLAEYQGRNPSAALTIQEQIDQTNVLNEQGWTEHQHQVRLIEWARYDAPEHRREQTKQLFAIPNGGKRTKPEAARLQAEGVTSGVSDLFLPVPVTWRRHGPAGLWIELKDHDGRATPAQIAFVAQMELNGYRASVCIGWRAAAETILTYLHREEIP